MVLTIAGFAFAGSVLAGPAAAAPTTSTVIIKSLGDCGPNTYFCYVPSPTTVSVGDTVLWTDQSGFGPHTVTRCDPQDCDGQDGGTGSDSPLDGPVGPGQDFSHTFAGPGTYVYYCRIHGYFFMHGSVTVAAPDTGSTTTTNSTTTTTTANSTTTTTTNSTTPTTTATSSSQPPPPAAASATTAVAAPIATASGAATADPITTRSPLARTGRDLRLVSIGLAIVGVGVVLVSAERRTRRRSE